MQTLTLEQILPVGVTLLTGPLKTGKTRLALEAAIALAGGPSHLALPVDAPTDVLYLAPGTDVRCLWLDTERALAFEPWTTRLFVSDTLPYRAQGLQAALFRWSETGPPPQVIIDPLQRLPAATAVSGDASDYTVMRELHGLALVFGIRILVVQHTRATSEARCGSSGAGNAADAVWRIEYSPAIEQLALTVVGRDIPSHDLPLTWDTEHLQWRA